MRFDLSIIGGFRMKNLLLALLLVGCASRPEGLTPPVQISRAAFLWNRAGGALAGDADLTGDARGNLLIRLTKSLPSPLLECTSMTNGKFHAEGPLAGGAWSGDAPRAPVRLALWTALAAAWRDAQPAKDGREEIHTASYRAAVWKDSGKINELSVSSNDNGEVIRLVFRRG
jgi:hypothetical protein